MPTRTRHSKGAKVFGLESVDSGHIFQREVHADFLTASSDHPFSCRKSEIECVRSHHLTLHCVAVFNLKRPPNPLRVAVGGFAVCRASWSGLVSSSLSTSVYKMRSTNAIASDLPASQIPLSSLESGWKYALDANFVADDATGVIVEVNPAAEKLTGFSRSELIGMRQADLHFEGEKHGPRRAFGPEPLEHAPQAGLHLVSKEGSLIPVEITKIPVRDAVGGMFVLSIIRDVSELKDRERRLAVKSWALRAYAGAALALLRPRSSATLVQEICEAITEDSIFVLAWVGFASDDGSGSLKVAGAAGQSSNYMTGSNLKCGEGHQSGMCPACAAIQSGTVQTVGDTDSLDEFSCWRLRAREAGIRSLFAAPFTVNGHKRGVLVVYSSQRDAFGPVVVDAFTHLAEEVGIGLQAVEQAEHLGAARREREIAQKERTAVFESVVGAITMAMEMRDPYTSGHQRTVAELVGAIGRAMGWSEERVEALKLAALVHDVGKISVPAEILSKPTRLSPPEWTLMQAHAQKGYEILKDVPFHWPIAEAVYQHHERLDGSGYPRGLKGDEIIPEARILAVADVVDSMASMRPYRSGRGIEVALLEIESQAGTRLDAEVVAVCLSLFREKKFTLGSAC